MSGNISECHLHEELEPFTYFYYLVFLVGIIGSCFALWAFTKKDQNQKCLSIYLINLLTADFLLNLALPAKIVVDLGIAPWSLRIFHRHVTACFIYLNMYLSIIFLGLVRAGRCLQLAHGSKMFRVQEPGFAKMLSAVARVTLLLIAVPNTAIPIKHIEERPGVGCIDFQTKFGAGPAEAKARAERQEAAELRPGPGTRRGSGNRPGRGRASPGFPTRGDGLTPRPWEAGHGEDAKPRWFKTLDL